MLAHADEAKVPREHQNSFCQSTASCEAPMNPAAVVTTTNPLSLNFDSCLYSPSRAWKNPSFACRTEDDDVEDIDVVEVHIRDAFNIDDPLPIIDLPRIDGPFPCGEEF